MPDFSVTDRFAERSAYSRLGNENPPITPACNRRRRCKRTSGRGIRSGCMASSPSTGTNQDLLIGYRQCLPTTMGCSAAELKSCWCFADVQARISGWRLLERLTRRPWILRNFWRNAMYGACGGRVREGNDEIKSRRASCYGIDPQRLKSRRRSVAVRNRIVRPLCDDCEYKWR